MKNKAKILVKDKKKYSLTDKDDLVILQQIYRLEKKRLSVEDKKLVKFIRTQLEPEWRVPIIKFLDKLLKKYH